MTRSLYFQKLDSGAGVLWNLCQNAMEQEIEEAMVVAAVLMQAAEPLGKQELQTRGAALISEIAQVEVILRVDEGLKILDRCGLIEKSPEDRYRLNT